MGEELFKIKEVDNFQFGTPPQNHLLNRSNGWGGSKNLSTPGASQLNLKLPSIYEPINTELESLRVSLASSPPKSKGQFFNRLQNGANAVSNRWVNNLKNFNPEVGTSGNYSSGSGDGFNARIGLTVIFGIGKPKLKLTSGIGYGDRSDNFGGAANLNFNMYNYGLGSSPQFNNGWNWDVTASAYITVGSGRDQAMAVQTLNTDTLSSHDNTFEKSLTYGQLLNFNSGINGGQFTWQNVQRQGLIGLRLADTQVMSNNDVAIPPYWGGDTDHGWTAGVTISHKDVAELSFEAFTGIASNYKGNFSPGNVPQYYTQTPFQESFNLGLTRFRFKDAGAHYDFEIEGSLWGQDLVHDLQNIPRFKPQTNQFNLRFLGDSEL